MSSACACEFVYALGHAHFLNSPASASFSVSHANAIAFKNKRVTCAHVTGRFLERMRHVIRLSIFACAL